MHPPLKLRKRCPRPDCRHAKVQQNELMQFTCAGCYKTRVLTLQDTKEIQDLTKLRDSLKAELKQFLQEKADTISDMFALQTKSNEARILAEQKKLLTKQAIIRKKNRNLINLELKQGADLNCLDSLSVIKKQLQKLIDESEACLNEKVQEIKKQKLNIRTIKRAIFSLLPLCDDQIRQKIFRLQDELEVYAYPDVGTLESLQFFVQQDDIFVAQQCDDTDYALSLKSCSLKWKEMSKTQFPKFEAMVATLRKTYLLIYYLAALSSITLPYIIQVDDNGDPQFMHRQIFKRLHKSRMVEFNDESVTMMQVNIYYIQYQLTSQVYFDPAKFFCFDELFAVYYRMLGPLEDLPFSLRLGCVEQGLSNGDSTPFKRGKLPISLAAINCPKFLLDAEPNLVDDFEIIQ